MKNETQMMVDRAEYENLVSDIQKLDYHDVLDESEVEVSPIEHARWIMNHLKNDRDFLFKQRHEQINNPVFISQMYVHYTAAVLSHPKCPQDPEKVLDMVKQFVVATISKSEQHIAELAKR